MAGERIVQDWARFHALDWRARVTFVMAWFMLPLYAALLRIPRLARRGIVGAPHAGRHTHEQRLDIAHGVGALVSAAAARTPFKPTCMVRSRVIGDLLRMRGIGSSLCVGVRMDEGRLDAHAWIEVDGIPVAERSDVRTRFAAFDLPQRPR
jgi:hypothetical protein